LNISLPWQIHAQEETTIISGREYSKKHALSRSEGSVQSCPELVEGKAAAILRRGAYMEYVSTKVRENGDLPTRSRFGRHGTAGLSAVALAKAGGFFQHFPSVTLSFISRLSYMKGPVKQ